MNHYIEEDKFIDYLLYLIKKLETWNGFFYNIDSFSFQNNNLSKILFTSLIHLNCITEEIV